MKVYDFLDFLKKYFAFLLYIHIFSKIYFAFFLYILAILIGYSRVYLGVHYPTDVLAGALCGTLIGYLGYKYIYLKIVNLLKLRFPEITDHERAEAKISNH